MSSNIAVLKNLVEGMSQEEKVKVAKEGHHPLVPVYMVVDSLKKEQEMDKTLQELEAASNLPPAEETIKDRLVAAVSRPGGLRSLDSATGSEAIGPSYAGALPDMPGLGAGEAMPRSYTGPTWAPQMPTGTMTAARGGVVPGYASGGFYGQQEEEDYLRGLSVDELNANYYNSLEPYTGTSGFSFPARPYGGESPSIGPSDPLGGPGFLAEISPAGLWGFATTRANKARNLARLIEDLKNVDPKTLTSAERATLEARKARDKMLEGQKRLEPFLDATKDAFGRGVTGTRDLFGRGATTTKDWLSGAGSTIGGARDRFTGGIRSLFNRTTPKKTSKTTPKTSKESFDEGHERTFGSNGGGGNRWKSTKSKLKTAGKGFLGGSLLLGLASLASVDPEEEEEYETTVRERRNEGLGDRLTLQEADSILAQAAIPPDSSRVDVPGSTTALYNTNEIPGVQGVIGDILNKYGLTGDSVGPTRTMASTAGSEAALQAIDDRMEKFRTDLGKLSPGQVQQAELIKEQMERLKVTRGAVIQRALTRQGEDIRTADEDLASLEDRYNTKVGAVDAITDKRIGQLEDRLQPRIDEGIASLESRAGDYDRDKRAATFLALSDVLGARNVDPRRSNFSSIGEAIGEFEDDELETATGMITDLRDIEDALEAGVIGYEDAQLLAKEQLGDALFAGQRDIRDRRRTDFRTAQDSILDAVTGSQAEIDALNAGNIQMLLDNEDRMNALNPSIMRTLNERYAAELRSEALDQEHLDALYQSELEGLATGEIPRIESELDAQRVQERLIALGDKSAFHYDNTLGEAERIEMIIRLRVKLLEWDRRTSRLTDDEVKEQGKEIDFKAGGVIPGYKHGGMSTLDLINRL
jgi:hypothetical protein